jgi:hypothetical protein
MKYTKDPANAVLKRKIIEVNNCRRNIQPNFTPQEQANSFIYREKKRL